MSRMGVLAEPKDGRALKSRHERIKTIIIQNPKQLLGISNAKKNTVLSTQLQALPPSTTSLSNGHLHDKLSFEVQPVVNDANQGVKLEMEDAKSENSLALEWVKSKEDHCSKHQTDAVQTQEFDSMLEMVSSGNDSGVSGSLSAVVDSGFLSSEFPDNLKDFVFSISDNLVKSEPNGQNGSENVTFSCLFEPEDTGAHETGKGGLSTINVQSSSLSLPNHSAEDPTMTSVISDNISTSSSRSRSRSSVFTENDIRLSNKMDFDEMGHTEASCDNIYQTNFLKSENFILSSKCDEDSVLIPSSSHSTLASLSTLPNSLSNEKNGMNITLNAVPNFLGLDHDDNLTSTTISRIIDQHGELHSLVDSDTSSIVKAENDSESFCNPVVSSQQSQPSTENVNVTTISISNNEERNATKIIVDTNQGQRQLYVINTADLNQQNKMLDGDSAEEEQPMYVINTADLNLGSSSNSTFLIAEQKEAKDSSSSEITTNSTSASVGVSSGFFLVPVYDNSSNIIQNVPVQTQDNQNKPTKKLLMCSEPGCSKTFRKASKLKVHQMLHTGERPYKCTLYGCEWAFTTAHKLKRHLESHEGRKDFACDHPGCGHKFTTVYNLNTHRKLHERPCTETCPEEGCGQRFPTKRQLELHLRNIHSVEERTFKCPKPGCQKVFFSSSCMGSHMRVHQQNSEDLKCKFPGCNKEFSKLCRLRQHERLHTGEKPFVCNYEGCTWAFATASKLKRHMTKHTGLRKWECHICQKHFQRSEHLKGHLITHSGDRPFVCPVEGCGTTFTAKSSLYVHIKKHDESGKTIVYHCPMEKCEKHYANKASLRQHILVKHCSLPLRGNQPQGAINWLNVLGSGESGSEMTLTQQDVLVDSEGLAQSALTPGHDSVMATDFLSGGMADQALLNSANDSLADQTCNNLISQLMASSGITSSSSTSSASTTANMPLEQVSVGGFVDAQHFLQEQQLQQLMEAGDLLQQQERISTEAAERGKKSQFVLENMHGSARTDTRSNDIISQRALKRWQKQKEIEAAKLGAHLEAQSQPTSSASVIPPVITSTGDLKTLGNSSVTLTSGQPSAQTVMIPMASGDAGGGVRPGKEIPDMELQAEGISSSVLDGNSLTRGDSFMTELFIRDPETGITYRQTQLLQDDPPNPILPEDMAVIEPSHSMVLDSGLEGNLMDETLAFHDFELPLKGEVGGEGVG